MGLYNFYIDESCHLENDGIPLMCLGYIKVPQDRYEEHKEAIKQIKLKHKSPTEIKWNKLSASREGLYNDLVDYFFAHELQFRCVLVKNTINKLDHAAYNEGGHNEFYNKIVYLLLKSEWCNPPNHEYWVYLDIKDTRGRERLIKLEEYLNRKYPQDLPYKHLQHIRSHESEFLQLADLFIGAVTFKARGEHLKENASTVKRNFVNLLEAKSGFRLDDGTAPWEEKFNIFDFMLSYSR